MEELVEFVSELPPEDQQWAFVSGSHDALAVSPNDLADLSIVDLYSWRSFTLFIPAKIDDGLCQLFQPSMIEVRTHHDRAV